MKIKFASLIFLFFLVLQGVSQNFNEKKTFVREKYIDIENHLKEYTKTSYIDQPVENQPPVGYYYFWKNSNNQIVKIYWEFGEEGYGESQSYYFFNDSLFFVYKENCEPNWDMDEFAQDCEQTRIYLYDEQIFDYLAKFIPADNTDGYIPNEKVDVNYKEETANVLKAAADMLEIAEKAQ